LIFSKSVVDFKLSIPQQASDKKRASRKLLAQQPKSKRASDKYKLE
jgi:hypothetical protein